MIFHMLWHHTLTIEPLCLCVNINVGEALSGNVFNSQWVGRLFKMMQARNGILEYMSISCSVIVEFEFQHVAIL